MHCATTSLTGRFHVGGLLSRWPIECGGGGWLLRFALRPCVVVDSKHPGVQGDRDELDAYATVRYCTGGNVGREIGARRLRNRVKRSDQT
jgi:hypothetical protein